MLAAENNVKRHVTGPQVQRAVGGAGDDRIGAGVGCGRGCGGQRDAHGVLPSDEIVLQDARFGGRSDPAQLNRAEEAGAQVLRQVVVGVNATTARRTDASTSAGSAPQSVPGSGTPSIPESAKSSRSSRSTPSSSAAARSSRSRTWASGLSSPSDRSPASPRVAQTTSYAILGLLTVTRWTTYELAKQVQRSLNWFWPRAERKIYDEPKTLAARGLAAASKEFTGQRPRTVYDITSQGREALRGWLDEPSAPYT